MDSTPRCCPYCCIPCVCLFVRGPLFVSRSIVSLCCVFPRGPLPVFRRIAADCYSLLLLSVLTRYTQNSNRCGFCYFFAVVARRGIGIVVMVEGVVHHRLLVPLQCHW